MASTSLASAFETEDFGEIKALLDEILDGDEVSVLNAQVSAEALLQELNQHLEKSLSSGNISEFVMSVGQYAVEKVKPKISRWEEHGSVLLEVVSAFYEADDEWQAAAHLLACIPLESAQRAYSPLKKFRIMVHISQLLLEDCNSVEAGTWIGKAASLQSKIPASENELLAQFHACYARQLDFQRKFLDASVRYHKLSVHLAEHAAVHEGEADLQNVQDDILTRAIVTCILAEPSPARARMLATLYDDERSASLPVWNILRDVHFCRRLKKDTVASFQAMLMPHQMAILASGFTVLEAAVIAHNFAAIAKVYRNISIAQCAAVLNVSEETAESLAAKMIISKALDGHIDQVSGQIVFSSAADDVVLHDKWIETLCNDLHRVVEKLPSSSV